MPLLRRAMVAGLLPLAVAGVLDLAFGTEVTLLAQVRTPEERAAWRATGWDPRDGVAELYGIVEPPPGLRVIVFDADKLVRPPEDEDLALLPVDRRAGEDVLLARALWGRAAVAAIVLALLTVMFVQWRGRARRGADVR